MNRGFAEMNAFVAIKMVLAISSHVGVVLTSDRSVRDCRIDSSIRRPIF
jgi:hypothetical protein